MRPITCTAALALSIALGGCATRPTEAEAPLTYVIVRHAEKSTDDPRDPSLSEAGQARAERLAASLAQAPMRAVYATEYRRTRQTGEPTARAHGLTMTRYDAKQAAAEFAATLRRDHRDGTVLVVGHSNTAPAIAAALCACDVAPMPETEFDRRMVVRIDAQGRASFEQTRDR
ncbi:histidine phosphatase family protein [Lysobacter antibioticus]|uniref:histidine phosphatase family protein n=1 Tax=Lysobacter antibioticus TaxID=84531 RepID=UPI00068B445E|nr:phosphoglycerate mutase family protein [Lysobacter antibioticus]